MGLYVVNHAYSANSGGKAIGGWSGGETVELEDDLAAWVNRDSECTLTAVDADAPAASADGLAAKTVKELVALAGERGVDLGKAKSKKDIVAVLEAADAPLDAEVDLSAWAEASVADGTYATADDAFEALAVLADEPEAA